MNIKEHENYIEIRDIERFAPKHTFECGQCFRWFEKDGKYEINKDECIDCGACAGSCPVEAPVEA